MNEALRCPKCGGEMGSDRKLGLYTEVTLKKGDEYVGERINVFYCKNCGFIELYKENMEGNK
jgi:predicted nucleic-acid-binding Zn-ribbon protein